MATKVVSTTSTKYKDTKYKGLQIIIAYPIEESRLSCNIIKAEIT